MMYKTADHAYRIIFVNTWEYLLNPEGILTNTIIWKRAVWKQLLFFFCVPLCVIATYPILNAIQDKMLWRSYKYEHFYFKISFIRIIASFDNFHVLLMTPFILFLFFNCTSTWNEPGMNKNSMTDGPAGK